MKNCLLFTALLLLGVAAGVQGQNREADINKIKIMYNEVQGYFSKQGFTTCVERTKKSTEDNRNGINYTQKVKSCSYENGYKIIFAELEGWEWAANINYYYKSGRLFFVLLKNEDVCGKQTERIYYNTYGSVIKVMQERDDCTEYVQHKNVEIYDGQERSSIVAFSDSHLRDVMKMLH